MVFYRLVLLLSYSIYLITATESNFPIKELFHIPEGVIMRDQQYLCSGFSKPGCCSCENDCMSKKFCCIDKLWNVTNPIPLEEYLQTVIQEAESYKDTTCEDVFPLATKLNALSSSYMMISKCLSNPTQEDLDGCNNVNNLNTYDYNIPVLGSDNFLYKNLFCARCNNIERFDLVNITASCRDSSIQVPDLVPDLVPPMPMFETTSTTTTTQRPKVNIASQFTGCIYQLQWSEAIEYNFVIKNSCSKKELLPRDMCLSTNKYYKLCNSYHATMGSYANYHCYLCIHGDENVSIKPEFECADVSVTVVNDLWSFTINFSEQTKISVDGPLSNIQQTFCTDNKVYNILTEMCETYTCSKGYTIMGHECQKLIDEKPVILKMDNVTFDKCVIASKIYLIIELNSSSNTHTFNDFLKTILNTAENRNDIEIFKNENMSILYTTIFINQTSFDLLNKELSDSDSYLWESIDNLYISKHYPVTTGLHGFDISRTFSHQRLCATPMVYDSMSSNFDINCSIILDNFTLNYDDFTLWLSFKKNSVQRKFSTCTDFYLQSTCKLIKIPGNYTIANNQTLIVNQKKYGINEYTPAKHSIKICTSTRTGSRSMYDWEDTVLEIRTYETYIGTSLSIVCYIIIITTYLYFKELRTVPSYITVGLCVTLLCGDGLLLITPFIQDNFNKCKTIGIILHWCLLATHTWAIVIAFDLLSKFGSSSLAIVKTSKKIFIKYCAFVAAVPTMIVGIVLVLDESSIFVAGYGNDNVCFIRNLYPRICFYIIPFAISFIATTGSFTKSIISISLQERKTRAILQNSGRKNSNVLMIGFKLVLTLGLIEMIGFIQIAKDELSEDEEIFNAVFGTLYTLVRALRGVILFVISLCTEQKLKLFKTLGKQHKDRNSFSRHSTHTKEVAL